MSHQNTYKLKFYQEELFNAKRNLFICGSVRRVNAIKQRIGFLDERIREIEGGM